MTANNHVGDGSHDPRCFFVSPTSYLTFLFMPDANMFVGDEASGTNMLYHPRQVISYIDGDGIGDGHPRHYAR